MVPYAPAASAVCSVIVGGMSPLLLGGVPLRVFFSAAGGPLCAFVFGVGRTSMLALVYVRERGLCRYHQPGI